MDRITRLFSLPESTLDALRASGQASSGQSLPDLNLWFVITLTPGTDAPAFMAVLKTQANVDVAHSLLTSTTTCDQTQLSPRQAYRGPAPRGIDANLRPASTLPEEMAPVSPSYDVEYNWLQTHEDLTKANAVTPYYRRVIP